MSRSDFTRWLRPCTRTRPTRWARPVTIGRRSNLLRTESSQRHDQILVLTCPTNSPRELRYVFLTEHTEGGRVSTCQRAERARTAVVLGGTSGIGKEIVKSLAAKGHDRLSLGSNARDARTKPPQKLDWAPSAGGRPLEPESIAGALASIPTVDDLVIPAIERDANTMANYNVAARNSPRHAQAGRLHRAIHALRDRFTPDASIVLFGGLAHATSLSRLDHRVDGQRRCRRNRQQPDHRTRTGAHQRHPPGHHW